MAALVSVIVPCRNGQEFIGQAVTSALTQSYQNIEVIVVDDGSIDESCKIIQALASADTRVKPLLKNSPQGASGARNAGIDQATGRFIAFLDCDDEWEPTKLDQQLRFMLDKNAGFSYTGYWQLSMKTNQGRRTRIHVPEQVDYLGLLKGSRVGCSTVILDREVFRLIRIPDIKMRNDFALWLELLRYGGIARGLDLPLTTYRVRRDSLSGNKIVAAAYQWKVYRDLEHLPFPTASALMGSYFFRVFRKWMPYYRKRFLGR